MTHIETLVMNEVRKALENLQNQGVGYIDFEQSGIIHYSVDGICIRVEVIAIKALEEIQQYRAIGTIEEFKALKEKNEPKKPILNNPNINEFYVKEAKLCPACHSYINNWSGDYCRDCGQKLDWSE